MKALISVSDKTGIVDLAKALHNLKVELVSTGGTAKLLAEQYSILIRSVGSPHADVVVCRRLRY